MRHWFKTPVSIWHGNVRRNVTSAEEAARLLLADWPGDTATAKAACLRAMEGGSVDVAEAAFRDVAKAAGVLVDD